MEGSIRVLHVDDEPDFGEMTATFLESEDDRFTVETATSSEEGLERLAEERFDCVVSDYDMPERNGIEFLEVVREDHPDLPFVLFTGKGSEAVASDAISAGVTDYLQKGTGTGQYAVLANRIRNAVSQQRAEQALTETERRYRRLIEEAADVITTVDRTGRFEYLSPAVEPVLGYTAEEVTGDNAFSYIHPDDHATALAEFESLVADPGGKTTLEARFENADGEWVWLEVRGRNLLDDPIVDGIVVYARDITARKEREQELERQNERLDEFAGIVSHDLRSPLTVAKGNLYLARTEGEQYLEEIEAALDWMEQLIDDLLSLARQGKTVDETEPVELDAAVADAWSTVETDGATVERATAGHVLEADEGRLRELLENLFGNAVEHGGNEVTVRVGSLENGFYVEDDGEGVDDTDEDLFEPGFTTDDEGTGFGLSIVRQIAEAHGWDVAVTESEDGGARFEVTGVGLTDG
jgi:PAS domain S-box-containing protein